jgi:hypothetical protein
LVTSDHGLQEESGVRVRIADKSIVSITTSHRCEIFKKFTDIPVVQEFIGKVNRVMNGNRGKFGVEYRDIVSQSMLSLESRLGPNYFEILSALSIGAIGNLIFFTPLSHLDVLDKMRLAYNDVCRAFGVWATKKRTSKRRDGTIPMGDIGVEECYTGRRMAEQTRANVRMDIEHMLSRFGEPDRTIIAGYFQQGYSIMEIVERTGATSTYIKESIDSFKAYVKANY